MRFSLINTINSFTSVNLDTFLRSPPLTARDRTAAMRPGSQPIALSMVSEIARRRETRGKADFRLGGVTTWRDAAEFIALGCGTVQVCTAAMNLWLQDRLGNGRWPFGMDGSEKDTAESRISRVWQCP